MSTYAEVLNQIGGRRYMELRQHIIERTPVQVSKNELMCAYSLGEPFFRRALEDMSLMPVDVGFVLYCMGRNGWTVEDLYDAYVQRRTRRIESIVCCARRCS